MTYFKRALKWIGISLAAIAIILSVILMLLPVFVSIAPYFLKPKVDAEIAAIKAKGQPVSAAELAGPKIPDAENAAFVYEKAFKIVYGPSARADFRAISEILRTDPLRKSPEYYRKSQELVTKYGSAIALAEQAISMSKCRFPVKWEDGIDAKFLHLGSLRNLSSLICTNAELNAREGRMNEAIQSIELACKLNESLKDEPYLVSQIVRYSIISRASMSLRHAARYGGISETEAKHLYYVLQHIDLSQSMALGLIGDRAMSMSFLNEMRENPRAFTDTPNVNSANPIAKMRNRQTGTSGFWQSLMYANELYYLRTMSKLIDLAPSPYRENKTKYAKYTDEANFPRYAFMAAISLPVLGTEMKDKAIAHVTGSQVFLALLAYKDRFGSYPVTLGELKSKLGWKLPDDPFSGKDFIFKQQGNGFLLYSIGEDLKDNGGIEPKSYEERKKKCDIVWQMVR